MLDLHQFEIDLNKREAEVRELEEALNLEGLRNRLSELEQLVQDPELWNDAKRAQSLQRELSHGQKRIERFEALKNGREELLVMAELYREAGEISPEEESELEHEYEKWLKQLESLRMETLFTGDHDENSAILTIHAGAGGTEAQDWAEMLYRMYMRWAEQHGYETRILNLLDGDEAGIKTVTFKVEGEYAYGFLKSEDGVHRLVRISPFDASGRRHTSFASLEVMPEIDETVEVEINPDDLRVDTYRASGAGGQHVNKTSSAVRITHIPTGVVVACQAERSQIQNRATAMQMLKSKLLAIAEAEKLASIDELRGIHMDIAWGSQIRSYVFHPYSMVKDHRTNYEVSDVEGVMDGDLDGFINAWLTQESQAGKAGASAKGAR